MAETDGQSTCVSFVGAREVCLLGAIASWQMMLFQDMKVYVIYVQDCVGRSRRAGTEIAKSVHLDLAPWKRVFDPPKFSAISIPDIQATTWALHRSDSFFQAAVLDAFLLRKTRQVLSHFTCRMSKGWQFWSRQELQLQLVTGGVPQLLRAMSIPTWSPSI